MAGENYFSAPPHHLVQRGHNRQTVFVEKQDYDYYLDTLHKE